MKPHLSVQELKSLCKKMQKNKKSNLTLKQRKFLFEYFKSGNGTRAAMKIYNTDDPNTAAVIANQNLRKLKNKNHIFMELRGLSIGKLVDVLLEGLEATTVSRIVKRNGTITHRLLPDHKTRHKFLLTAGRWKGLEEKADEEHKVSIYEKARDNADKYVIREK